MPADAAGGYLLSLQLESRHADCRETTSIAKTNKKSEYSRVFLIFVINPLPNLRRPPLHMASTLIFERLLPIALSRLTIHVRLQLPKNGVKPKCRQNQKTDAVALTRHCRVVLLGIIPCRLSCSDAPNSSDHCFLMCGGPEPRGTLGLTKAFVSFGHQKKFIHPAGTDGPSRQ